MTNHNVVAVGLQAALIGVAYRNRGYGLYSSPSKYRTVVAGSTGGGIYCRKVASKVAGYVVVLVQRYSTCGAGESKYAVHQWRLPAMGK
jgi:hypothetical protein